jgi:hypothetical protein
MEKLSQELIDRITSFVSYADLDPVLTVSKAFQASVETTNLKKFTLKQDNADKFLQLYTSDRIRHLRTVKFRSTFPMVKGEYDEEYKEKGCREKSSDLAEKDRLFSQHIKFLFETLKHLEDKVGPGKLDGRLRLTIFPPSRAIDWPCRHRDCVCWRVHLRAPETLPQLRSIRYLCLKQGTYYDPLKRSHADPKLFWLHAEPKLDLRIILDLASRLPSLERLKYRITSVYSGSHATDESKRHYLKDWVGPHRDTRHDFARSVEHIKLPSSLKHLELNFHPQNDEYRDQRELLPNLVLPYQHDHFSSSLRLLSYQLETMVLRVTADNTLFWPTDGTTPFWPNLKRLEVKFTPDSPSGAWYFQGPQGEGSDAPPGYEITKAHYEPMDPNPTDEHYDKDPFVDAYIDQFCAQFRIVPIEQNLQPFLTAFAKAAACMPSLQKALLWTELEFEPSDIYDHYESLLAEIDGSSSKRNSGSSSIRNSLAWGIAYSKPKESIALENMGHKNYASRQFWWMTGNWRPDETLHSMFHNIGQLEHGSEVVDYWAGDYGHKWCSERMFLKAGFGKGP